MSPGGDQRPSPATALSLLALVVAISGGSAYAGSQLSKGSGAEPKALTVLPPKNVKASSKSLAEAPKHKLFERGPFKVYAKCVLSSSPSLHGYVFFQTTNNKGVGFLNATGVDGDPSFLEENSFQIEDVQTGSLSAASGRSSALGISGKVSTDVSVNTFVKEGSPLAGDGTYGNGDRCIFQLTETGTG